MLRIFASAFFSIMLGALANLMRSGAVGCAAAMLVVLLLPATLITVATLPILGADALVIFLVVAAGWTMLVIRKVR